MRRKRKLTVSGFLQKLLKDSSDMSLDELHRRALDQFGERKAITESFGRTVWNAKKALRLQSGIQKPSQAIQRPRKRRRKRTKPGKSQPKPTKSKPKPKYFLIRKRCSAMRRVSEDLYNDEKYIARAGFTFVGKVSEAKELFAAGKLPAVFINDPKLRTRLIQKGTPPAPKPTVREMPTPEERAAVLACAKELLKKKKLAKKWGHKKWIK